MPASDTTDIQISAAFDPIAAMQEAVDIVNDSPHPTNKIAATIFGIDQRGKTFSLSRTNCWPNAIIEKFGTAQKIGSSSGTIHAETACIFAAPYTFGAHICITDPFCPNCAKNMAEAGITHIYIDHKGLDKDWISRNREDFAQMSMRICKRAGIAVSKIRRKDRVITPILEIPADYAPLHENPPQIIAAPQEHLHEALPALIAQHKDHEFAAALAHNIEGEHYLIFVRRHAAIGYSRDVPDSMEERQGKYSFVLQPLNRLLMTAPRHGLKLIDGEIFSSRVPTAREQVNFVGAGLTQLIIGDRSKARDEGAFAALEQLTSAGILNVTSAT